MGSASPVVSPHIPLEQVRARRACCQNRPESLLNWKKGVCGRNRTKKSEGGSAQPRAVPVAGPGQLPLVPLPRGAGRTRGTGDALTWYLGAGKLPWAGDSKWSSPQGACGHICYSLLLTCFIAVSMTRSQAGATRSPGLESAGQQLLASSRSDGQHVSCLAHSACRELSVVIPRKC